MFLKNFMLLITIGVMCCTCGTQIKSVKQTNASLVKKEAIITKTDSIKKSLVKILPYNELITYKTVTDNGLFKIHKKDNKYFFEIHDSLLNIDILIVNQITKAATMDRGSSTIFGYAGDELGKKHIQFSKGFNNTLFIKSISYTQVSKDSSDNGMYHSVRNSNLQPIVASFDIKAYTPDSTGVVIDATDLLEKENELLFIDKSFKKNLGLGILQSDKSYIDKFQSFPKNVVICAYKTYAKGDDFATYRLSSTFFLLPKVPMMPRYLDNRIGYFGTYYTDFDANPQGIEITKMITRWKLEPKQEDMEKYKRGELVEPMKPIVYYIDPTTPKKWVPYLIKGVTDWQKAFEKAGFKNAIYAREVPTKEEDSTWSPEDALNSMIVYKPSAVMNASGPNVHDPRSGEILESHINWYHNVMQLLHDWYFVQAAAIDPKARTMKFTDSLMGQLIRFVSSHEVGHTLGLTHNYGSSSTVPVDSLRSKRWVEAHGHTPSIMDYARFNYVAQPEDSISDMGIFPRIGVYDEWAIEWGYRLFPQINSEKEEKKYLNNWVIKRISEDKRLWFGDERNTEDPRCQSEDLGNDAIKASILGIKNLKRIQENLIDWTKIPSENYENLKRLQLTVSEQYKQYALHVAKIIGGVYYTPKTSDEVGTVFAFPSSCKQTKALAFLKQYIFTTPEWLMDKKIFSLTGWGDPINILAIQHDVLRTLLSQSKMGQMRFATFYEPKNAYSVPQYLNDLKECIWEDLRLGKPIDEYKRNLQKVYTLQLISLLEYPDLKALYPGIQNDAKYYPINLRTDVSTLIWAHIKLLITEINSSLFICKDHMTRLHLIDMRNRLTKVIKAQE